MKRRPFLWIVLVGLLMTEAAAQSEPPKPKPISSERLTYELALTRKLLADELFLQDRRDDASKEYAAAERELSSIGSPAEVTPTEKQLLADEIKYRTTLLKAHLGFWGAAYSRTPINPVAAYSNFQESVAEFTKLAGSIETLLDKADDKASTDIQLNLIQQKRDADIASLDKERSVTRQRYNNRQVAMLNDRKSSIREAQEAIAQKSGSLREDLSRSTARLNSLIAKGISQAIGMPDLEQLQSAAQSKSFGDIIATTADSMLGDQNSSLSKALQSYSKATSDLAEFYRKAKSSVEQARRLKADAERASALLRSRSIDDLIEAGNIIYERLDERDKARLRETVSIPDLKAIANLARRGRNLREQVSEYLRTTLDLRSEIAPILKAMIDTRFNDFALLYRDLLKEAALNAREVDQQLRVVRALFRDWSRVIADEILDDDAIIALAAHFNIEGTSNNTRFRRFCLS
jgi:hypothetical protein